jgi:hypothetical protein
MLIGIQCTSGKTLNMDSDLDSQRYHKTPLIGYGAELGEISNVKVI